MFTCPLYWLIVLIKHNWYEVGFTNNDLNLEKSLKTKLKNIYLEEK